MVSYINVPVPEHLVPAVMGLITEKMAVPVSVTSAWTDPELRKVWGESAAPMRTTLALLAKHTGTAVSIADIAKAIGKTPGGHAVAGMMGAFGRRIKGRHKGKPAPFVATWNAVAGYWEYKMAPAIAKIILALAEESS